MKYKAISLIESLVYLAIFAIFFLSVIQFLMSMSDANLSAREKQQLETAAMFVNNHLTAQLEDAQTIVVGVDTFTLTIDSIDYVYSIVSDELVVTSQSVTEQITPSFATVSNVSLTAISEGVVDVGLEISMDLISEKEDISTRHIDLTLLLGSI